MAEVYHEGGWMTSHYLLSFAAILLFLTFLYSNGSYSNTQVNSNTDGSLFLDTRSLASKALLRRDNVNTLLSPHIYNVPVRQEYHLRELTEPFELGDAEGGEACQEHATEFCSSNDQLRVARVSFIGSAMEWTLCHCVTTTGTKNPEPWPYLLSHLSRLPTPLRRQIRTIMLAPLWCSPLVTPSVQRQNMTPPHGMFTASPPLVTFFGYPGIGTWIHEFAHSADFRYSTSMLSASKQWTSALERDSCVADEYARTSWEEALAQAAIVKSYLAGRPRVSNVYSSRNIEGIFTGVSYAPSHSREYNDALVGDYSCMKHQLMTLGCLDAWYTSADQSDGCAELQDAGSDETKNERKVVPRSGTWWELWLTLLLIDLATSASMTNAPSEDWSRTAPVTALNLLPSALFKIIGSTPRLPLSDPYDWLGYNIASYPPPDLNNAP